MIKSASTIDAITEVNTSIVGERMSKEKDDVFSFSRFYIDDQGLIKDRLVAFRTKITFPTYSVMI